MRNSKICTAILAALITLGAVSTGFAEQSKDIAKDSMMKGQDMHMMEGNKMPMMDMMQEMSSMMKDCSKMMQSMSMMNMGDKAPQGDSKAQ
ncbi:hypothetical protein NVV94_14380 [Pseudomonas sp. LS1212]|uniref:hypothetical protein n=1 Tax=Pseudomonas sp. LS1212 TaxID=2972478 RepID=UPI00215BC1FD|nr:hypothetical protein [Pseudomonas sp. LS1212]UVJ41892.1 hypothetical protein NVV94_14380 [Pseudomonas sp. LS1212]